MRRPTIRPRFPAFEALSAVPVISHSRPYFTPRANRFSSRAVAGAGDIRTRACGEPTRETLSASLRLWAAQPSRGHRRCPADGREELSFTLDRNLLGATERKRQRKLNRLGPTLWRLRQLPAPIASKCVEGVVLETPVEVIYPAGKGSIGLRGNSEPLSWKRRACPTQ